MQEDGDNYSTENLSSDVGCSSSETVAPIRYGRYGKYPKPYSTEYRVRPFMAEVRTSLDSASSIMLRNA